MSHLPSEKAKLESIVVFSGVIPQKPFLVKIDLSLVECLGFKA
jgi:hypothetical protein